VFVAVAVFVVAPAPVAALVNENDAVGVLDASAGKVRPIDLNA
jgi:hypothetical protein